MNKTVETQGRGKARRLSPIDEARILFLHKWLAARDGELWLNYDTYRDFHFGSGLSRAELHRTIDLMVERGLATLAGHGHGIAVRLAEGNRKGDA